MTSKAKTPDEYLKEIPADRQSAFTQLREVILKNLPKGFEEGMSYGMISYYVPHALYPAGYHCNPKDPLPFANIASQKNSINFYHMGMYAQPELLQWFQDEYPKHSDKKLDMGKSCIRFKRPEDIPFRLIGDLIKKMSVAQWIAIYESTFKKK